MKTVFISLPLAGKNPVDVDISIGFAKKEYLDRTGRSQDDDGICFMDNSDARINDYLTGNTVTPALLYLGYAIGSKMSIAEEVIFVKGWEKARGCRIEHQICEEYGIKIFECERWNPLMGEDPE